MSDHPPDHQLSKRDREKIAREMRSRQEAYDTEISELSDDNESREKLIQRYPQFLKRI